MQFVEAKVVYAPIGTKTTKNGEEKPNFVRLGIKVTFDNGITVNGQSGPAGYAFYSFRHDSISITRPAMPLRDNINQVIVKKGKVQWSEQSKSSRKMKEFEKNFAPPFVALVKLGLIAAEQAEAEKRAA